MYQRRLTLILKCTRIHRSTSLLASRYPWTSSLPVLSARTFSSSNTFSGVERLSTDEITTTHEYDNIEKPKPHQLFEKLDPSIGLRGPPDSAVTRALKNEPDLEWDAIVSFDIKNSNSLFETNELFDELDSTDSNDLMKLESTNQLEFYDWQWKIIGTARLLETPMGDWRDEQWFSAENILANGWPQQHCIRAVILQFALLRRACQEIDCAKSNEDKSSPLIEEPITATSPYNSSIDNVKSLGNSDSSMDSFQRTAMPEERLGRKTFSPLVDNWRCVYIAYPDMLRQIHLGPRDLLGDIVSNYSGKYGIPLSEKVFRLLLVAETHHLDGNSQQFAETVLSLTLDLYDSGMEDCLPTTPLWNSVLFTWIMAERRQETRNAVSRLVKLMDELKIQRSRNTYRLLFKECLQRGTEESARDAEDLLRQMYKEFLLDNFRVQPDMSSFIYVVDAWAKSKSHLAGPRAEQIYEQMKALRAKNHFLEVGETAETRFVNCVLKCWAIIGTKIAAEKAEAFWRHSAVAPDSTMYSTLINLYAKSSDVEGAERLWNELTTAVGFDGKAMNEMEFAATSLLSAYAKSNLPNKVDLAEGVIMRMKTSANTKLDTACYNGKLFGLAFFLW
jgi:pentatricopeptide repeat protein